MSVIASGTYQLYGADRTEFDADFITIKRGKLGKWSYKIVYSIDSEAQGILTEDEATAIATASNARHGNPLAARTFAKGARAGHTVIYYPFGDNAELWTTEGQV